MPEPRMGGLRQTILSGSAHRWLPPQQGAPGLRLGSAAKLSFKLGTKLCAVKRRIHGQQVHIHTCIEVHICIYEDTYTHTCIYIYMIYVYTDIYACIYIQAVCVYRTRACPHAHACTLFTYVHAHMRTYMHTYMCMYVPIRREPTN